MLDKALPYGGAFFVAWSRIGKSNIKESTMIEIFITLVSTFLIFFKEEIKEWLRSFR
jgi:hypothetical protein